MRLKLARSGLATAAIVATTLVVQAPIAQAAIVRSFDVETIEGARPHHGSAHTWGSLTWHNSTRVVANGRINDRCPGDGYGAYLDVAVQYMSGAVNDRYNVARDTSTCDSSADGVAFPSPVVFDSTRSIRTIRFCLWEINVNTNPDSVGNHNCKEYDNPYT